MPTLLLEDDQQVQEGSIEADFDYELIRCEGDVSYFIDTYGVIDDAQDQSGMGGGTTRFRLWAAQVELLWTLMVTRLVVILKARQLGISWAICGYVLWLVTFRSSEVLLLSKGQPEANELLRRVRTMFDRLPDWMRARLPRIVKDNTRQLEFSNGSRIRSLPATKNAGISYTASLVVMDEAAHLKWGEDLLLNVKPTIDAGGQLIILSTANGFGGMFHAVWTKAVEGLNNFRTVFLPWWVRPGRTAEWFRGVKADAVDPKLIPQNYPANPIEAFLASGATRFEPEWIAAQVENVLDPIAKEILPADLAAIRGISVWKLPEPGRKYLISGDVAEGLETGDYDSADVLDCETWEQVATLHGHWEPYEFAESLIRLSRIYNDAAVGPERNNHGHAVLTAFRLARGPDGLPDPFRNVAIGPDGKEGWETNKKTKPGSIDLLAEALKLSLVTIHSAATLHELQVYRRLNAGKTGAPEGFHDDRVMSLAIGLSQIRVDANRPTQGPPAAGGSRPTFNNMISPPPQLRGGVRVMTRGPR
jgi:hypothetical protein